MSDVVHRLYDRLPARLRGELYRRRRPRSPFTPQVVARRAIFVHIPKAAGTSIKQEIFGRNTGGHRTIAEFTAADPAKTEEFFKFTFVRNPWDRLLACYSYLRHTDAANVSARRFAAHVLDVAPEFDLFVDRLTEPGFRALVMDRPHFRAQTHWICLPGESGHRMDFVGRYETLATDLASVADHLGLGSADPADRPRSLAHARSSGHVPYREAYSKAMRDVVAEMYARDIVLLDYDF